MISWENQPEPVDDDEGATREKLAARRYMAVRAVGEAAERRRVLREQEPEDRHMGTDQGRHHQNRLPTGPATGCGCGCQSVLEDESLLAIVGRQALDPVERYDLARAEARAMLHGRTSRTLTGEQALRELDAMRVKFSVVDE